MKRAKYRYGSASRIVRFKKLFIYQKAMKVKLKAQILKGIFSRAIDTALAIFMSACNSNAEEIFDAKSRNLEIQLVCQ